MKKLYFLLLFPVLLQAQIVNIPDANFKALLIGAGIDTNSNGQIELSEAQAATSLDLYETTGYPVNSTGGIQSFSNLIHLGLSLPHVPGLSLSGFSQLHEIYFTNGFQPASTIFLQLIDMPSLQSVFSDSAQLASFSLTNCPALKTIHLDGTTLYSLDLTAFPLLENVWAENFVSLNVSGLTHLTNLNCDSTFLSSLNVAGCTALTTLSAMNSHVTNLDVSGLAALQTLDLGSGGFAGTNPPTHLNASGCTSLHQINAIYCNIQEMDLTGCSSLVQVSAESNGLDNIVLTGCTALQTLSLDMNNLTMIDASDCHSLTHLSVGGNPLQFIFIKNGTDDNISFTNLPGPQFICADDIDLPSLQPFVDTGVTTIDSYCTFTPGGDYNTISGNVHYDIDGNGCDASDPAAQVQIGFNDGTTQFYTYSANGHYTLYTGAGNIQLAGNFPAYWTAVNPSPVYFSDNQNHTAAQDFCLVPNGVHHDVEINSFPSGSDFVPGFDTAYKVQVRNKGNQTESGMATLAFDPAILSVVSALGATVASGLVSWNFSGLLPFQRQDFQVTFHLNAPTDVPGVNIGDALTFTASAIMASDEFPDDNAMENHETVVGSYDPNEIFCAEGDQLPTAFIGEALHYIVNFENTGTADAQNVVAKILIDPNQYDISTLQPMGASHTVNTVITGNKVEFIFQNIGLAPNEYGYVAYSIKSRNTLVSGDSVSSAASIYFDFNAPVVTNTATTVFQNLGLPSHVLDNDVNLYPNPASAAFSIRSAAPIMAITIMDQQGRVLRTVPASGNDMTATLDGMAQGVYLVTVRTANGTITGKLIKS